MTIMRSVAEPLIVHTKTRGHDLRRRVENLLDIVGLSKQFIYRYPHELSGGQKQRVCIARAIALEPSLLILDEPTSALDPELEQEVVKVIKQLAAEGRTMLLVTHDMRLARDVSSHVVFLHQGLVGEEGPPETLFGNPQTERLRSFLSNTSSV